MRSDSRDIYDSCSYIVKIIIIVGINRGIKWVKYTNKKKSNKYLGTIVSSLSGYRIGH